MKAKTTSQTSHQMVRITEAKTTSQTSHRMVRIMEAKITNQTSHRMVRIMEAKITNQTSHRMARTMEVKITSQTSHQMARIMEVKTTSHPTGRTMGEHLLIHSHQHKMVVMVTNQRINQIIKITIMDKITVMEIKVGTHLMDNNILKMERKQIIMSRMISLIKLMDGDMILVVIRHLIFHEIIMMRDLLLTINVNQS